MRLSNSSTLTIRIPDPAAAPRWLEADYGTGSGGDADAEAAPSRDLIKALVRAHCWRRRIESGQARSITDLAEQEGVQTRTSPVAPATRRAPDVVEAILDGRQPKALKLAEVLGNGPIVWEEQLRAYAFQPR